MSFKSLLLEGTPTASYIYPILLAVWAGLLFFPALGERDFWAPVEPRYAEIARVMFVEGEWIVPKVNGEIYTDKPIFYFWLVLIGSKLLGGVNEWTVRLPSALGALGLVLTTYALGRDFFNPRVGLYAGVILATCARVLWEARWAHTDMLFSFFSTLGLYLFARAIFEKGKPSEILLAYALIGLATLTKGLIGVVLPGLVLLAFVVCRAEWRSIFEWRLGWGLLIFLLVTLPWFGWVSAATDGKWLQDFLYVHHFQRYTSGSGHRQPFYYYLMTLPADFSPWSIFAAPAVFAYRPIRARLQERATLFFLLWFFLILLFFSFSSTKRDLYLLPLFTPSALFIACYFDQLTRGTIHQDGLYRGFCFVFFSLLATAGLSLPFLVAYFQQEAVGISSPFAVLLVAGGAAALLAVWRGAPLGVFFSTAGTFFLGFLYAALCILPFINEYKSPKPFALKVKEIVDPARSLYIYADTMNDFNFYTEREVIPILASPGEVRGLASHSNPAYLLIRARDLKKLDPEVVSHTLAMARIGDKSWYLAELTRRK
ncbi:MAG: glycosyltransferase family 39 protein [Deltaproteobacteria bacterium]|nr:glycosyltransferase family 39 protein [Deltaproteobacteria bacterium]